MNAKGSKFLNAFWDLASDDRSTRCQAGKRIIMHIHTMQKKSDGVGMCSDGEYALQRLVRGLSSSRDSARQGFSACLCQFLVTFPSIDASDVIRMIDDNTKISSNMRGAEERDLMFGKLFGYLALIRSGRLAGDCSNIVKALCILVELHQRKAWIREVVSESILHLLQQFYADKVSLDVAAAESVVSKLNSLLPPTDDYEISDLPAHFLVLLHGLQKFAKDLHVFCGKAVCDVFSSLTLPKQSIFAVESFASMSSTLLAACGGFPKIHRVWHTILSCIFGECTENRVLPTQRLKSIGAYEESLLIAFVTFIDENLVNQGSSNEKRGVFLKLVTELLRLTPCNLLPVVFTKSMVRCITFIRMNKKHKLYALAGVTLNDIVNFSTTSGDDSESRLCVANTFVKYEGAMFDAKTNCSTVKDLLSNLDSDMVMSYVQTLAGVIAKTITALSAANVNDEAVNDDEAISAVLALAAIVKNPRIAERGNLAAVIVSILIRLACFTPVGCTPSCHWSDNKKKSKKSKKSPENIFVAMNMQADKAVIDAMVDNMQVIEGSECAAEIDPSRMKNIVRIAGSSLLNVLADIGHVNIDNLNHSLCLMENGKNGGDRARSDSITSDPAEKRSSLLHFAMMLLIYLSETGGLTLLCDSGDEEAEGRACLEKLKSAAESLSRQLETKNEAISLRMAHACFSFLGQSVFHVLCSEEVGVDCLESICELLPSFSQECLVKLNNDRSLKLRNDSVEENEDNDDGIQLSLFEACMDLLAVSDSHPVKGVRDATKRFWTTVVHFCYVESAVIEAIISCVVGDDVDGDDRNDNDDSSSDTEKDDSDEDADVKGEESVDENIAIGTDENSDNEDSDGEEDILLDESSTMKLLEGSDNESQDDDVGAVDDAGMDSALVNMIKMRKENRKQGLLQAKRQEFIVRSRAIDILEIFIHRNDDTSISLPMFYPLLYCLKKISNSSIAQSLQEGRSFEHRVRSVIENKLCKSKFSLNATEKEDSDVLIESTSELLTFISKCIRSSSPSMRLTSTCCFLSVSRGIISGKMGDALSLLTSSFRTLVVEYLNKKNSRVPVKVIDEVYSRFPDFSTGSSLPDVIEGTESAPTSFLRADAFRMLGSILKRHQSLSQGSQQQLFNNVDDIIACFVKTLQAKEDMKAKRMKSVLHFGKDFAQYLNGASAQGNKIKASSVEQLLTVLSSDPPADNRYKAICDNVIAVLSSIPLDSTSTGLKSKKLKKQKGMTTMESVEGQPNKNEKLKKPKKKRSSAELDDDDDNFIDYEREMINKIAAQTMKEEDGKSDDRSIGNRKSKIKKHKTKK